MQNCGMATGLAIQVLNSTQIALPAAIFGPWMSVSGAMLAAWWQGSAIEIRDTVPPGDDASAAGTA
jgi:BASS family bile acid:Na+ symporter